jgi:hypothetical protein
VRVLLLCKKMRRTRFPLIEKQTDVKPSDKIPRRKSEAFFDNVTRGAPPPSFFVTLPNELRNERTRIFNDFQLILAEFLTSLFNTGVSVGVVQLYGAGVATGAAANLLIGWAQVAAFVVTAFVFSPYASGFGNPFVFWSSVLIYYPRTETTAWKVIGITLVVPAFQFVGAIAGTALFDYMFGRALPALAQRGRAIPRVASGQEGPAILIELFATFLLCYTVSRVNNTALLTTSDRELRKQMGGPPQSGNIVRPIVGGLAFSLFVFAGAANISGVALSPFRQLAPMIVLGTYASSWWVHLVGPAAGFVFTLLVSLVFDQFDVQ